MTEDEKTKHVTKTVIAQSTNPEDKKKRSSKYSVAVGSSFGHGKNNIIFKILMRKGNFHHFLPIITFAVFLRDLDIVFKQNS